MRLPSMLAPLAAFALLVPAACRSEHTGTVEGPPLTFLPVDASAEAERGARDAGAPALAAAAAATTAGDAQAASSSPDPALSPVSARFVDLTAAKVKTTFHACEQYFVAVARGKATVAGESLGEGDIVVLQGSQPFDVAGQGLALVATVRPRVCEPSGLGGPTGLTKHVVRARTAPALTWAAGKMRAHLDVEGEAAQLAYLGRLDGSAPVAEHVHESSWEVLCAVDAAGTFTLAGKEERLAPRQIVVVPPNTKHSWRPDAGSSLVALQMYAPAGPEQRFRKLAADEAKK
jgi:mannose-6-phosphate isomerase-like protein (cupin superfamily)